MQSLSPCLEEMAELVHEDQQHEADCELPAPDQGVAPDGDEDAEELDGGEAELGDQEDRRADRCPDPPKQPAPVGAPRMDRVVLTLHHSILPGSAQRVAASASVSRAYAVAAVRVRSRPRPIVSASSAGVSSASSSVRVSSRTRCA